jgi:asparagine synthase (glutamine-hydrolysing)
MCGIAGIVNLKSDIAPPAREALLRMASTLFHRGPDEVGLYRDRQAGLAHTRLSIIDVANGHQPMANEDDTLWIVFNGEIFNYLELRSELEALGHRFRTRSDTEVILHAYEAWADGAFARMNGQWALALWDSSMRRLVFARDRFGVRPLYVCEHSGRLYFASEVKAIFAADRSIPRELDSVGIDQTLTFWTVIAPRSVFRGIEELRPAHVRTYEDGTVREHAYWEQSYPSAVQPDTHFRGSLDDAVSTVRTALTEAVKLRVARSDVAVGSYLSGGLDSSFVSACAAQYTPRKLQTFSISFADSEYDETVYQELVAQQIGSEHHRVTVTRADIARVFPEVIYHAERPLLRTAPAPLYMLSRLVRDCGIKVVLTGEGADEMFGGYDLFREGKVRRFWALNPESRLRPRALERLYPYLTRSPIAQQAIARQFFGQDLERYRMPGFAHATRWKTTSALKRLLSPAMRETVRSNESVPTFIESLPPAFSTWAPLAQDQYIENRTLLSGYLLASQGDRMLMANSVEGRFPFLDKDVVALADSLPASYKLRVLDEKHVLKKAARGCIPDAVIGRKKQPYRAPDALCFAGPDAPDYVSDLLSADCVRHAGIFDPIAIDQLFRKCRRLFEHGQFSNTDNMALVGALSAQLLHEQYVRAFPLGHRPLRIDREIDRLQSVAAS